MVDLSSYAEALTKLRNQRNGIGHFGSADLDSVVDHLPTILAAAVDLTHGLVEDAFVIFRSHREFALERLDEWADAEQRELAGRFTQARLRLAERYPPLTPAMRAVIERTIRDGHETNRTPDDQLATCPACGLPADLEGTFNIEFDVSGDRDGVDVNPTASTTP